jgi:hypothetical protein
MNMTNTIIRSSLIATLALSMSAFAGAASAAQLKARVPAPPPHQLGLKAPGGGGQTHGHVETCNNKASCNLMIAYCAGHGGDWEETGTPGPQGEPQKGKCTYP